MGFLCVGIQRLGYDWDLWPWSGVRALSMCPERNHLTYARVRPSPTPHPKEAEPQLRPGDRTLVLGLQPLTTALPSHEPGDHQGDPDSLQRYQGQRAMLILGQVK